MGIEGSKPFPGGTVFPNSGGSHITTQEGGRTHITSEIGGLKQGGQVGVHIPVDNQGNVGQADPFFRMIRFKKCNAVSQN